MITMIQTLHNSRCLNYKTKADMKAVAPWWCRAALWIWLVVSRIHKSRGSLFAMMTTVMIYHRFRRSPKGREMWRLPEGLIRGLMLISVLRMIRQSSGRSSSKKISKNCFKDYKGRKLAVLQKMDSRGSWLIGSWKPSMLKKSLMRTVRCRQSALSKKCMLSASAITMPLREEMQLWIDLRWSTNSQICWTKSMFSRSFWRIMAADFWRCGLRGIPMEATHLFKWSNAFWQCSIGFQLIRII